MNHDAGEKRVQGFTLIELMVASLIFVLGGISIMALLVCALAANHRARLEFAALHLSEQKIEELKAMPFHDARLSAPGCPLDANGKIDFSGSPVSTHTTTTSLSLQVGQVTTLQYETRWNVSLVFGKKIITVATKAASAPANYRPVNLKIVRAY